jgi:hypothetical protein
MFPLEIHLYFPQLQSKEDTLLSYDLFLQQNQKIYYLGFLTR